MDSMYKLHFSILINAPKEKVWKTMLEGTTYRQWTAPFMQGSYFDGDWSAGSSMRFLAPDKDGTLSGMYSQVKENRPYDFISVQHLGEIIKGKEILWPQEADARENYTFIDKNGATEVQVDLTGLPDGLEDMFQGMWPKALEKLKELAES